MANPEVSGDRPPEWRARLAAEWPGELKWNQPLRRYTTLRVGGPAAALARPADERQLADLLALLAELACPWRVIGKGSNLLVADQGFNGVVVLLDKRMGRIEVVARTAGEILLRVGAGAGLAALLSRAALAGWSGLEFLVGIPGSVGGALLMNAGAFGHALGDRVRTVESLDCRGQAARQSASALTFGYRRLAGLSVGAVVTAVTLALTPDQPSAIRQRMAKWREERQAGQPQKVASAGSFFRNPPGDYAGRLIEQAGLKGRQVGGAMVSPVHANFLVNSGGATAAEMVALMRLVQEEVRQRFGVDLEPEVHLLGDFKTENE